MHSTSKIKKLGGRGRVILQTLHRCRGRELPLRALNRTQGCQAADGPRARKGEGRTGRGPRFLKTDRCVFNCFIYVPMFLL